MGEAGQGEQVDWPRAALLGVWNPRLGPDTIAVHVESLKAAPADRKWTWWGRIYAGQKPDAKLHELWPWIGPMTQRKEFVLYVTSFDALHALRIDAVSTTPPPEGPPASYALAARVPLWFRVRDIRAQQWTSRAVAEALEDFAPIGGDGRVDRTQPFDPYAATPRYWPIAVEPIDRQRRDEFEDAAGFDCHLEEDVAYPNGVREAAEELAGEAPSLWARLAPTVQHSLATARALRCERRLSGSDRSASVVMISRALEQLGVAFVRAAWTAVDGRAPAAELNDLFQETGWRKSTEDPTFGQLPRAVGKLCGIAERHLGLRLELEPLCRLLEAYAPVRNDAVHGRVTAGLDVAAFEASVWSTAAAAVLKATATLAARVAAAPPA